MGHLIINIRMIAGQLIAMQVQISILLVNVLSFPSSGLVQIPDI